MGQHRFTVLLMLIALQCVTQPLGERGSAEHPSSVFAPATVPSRALDSMTRAAVVPAFSLGVDRDTGPFSSVVGEIEPASVMENRRPAFDATAAGPRLVSAPVSDWSEAFVSVSGSLSDASGEPIVGERVFLSSLDQRSHYSAASDLRGVFTFSQVPPDHDYRLAIVPADRFRKLSIDPLIVRAGMAPMELVLDEVVVGQVSGSVVDSQGQAAAYLDMVLYSTEVGIASMAVQTDATGFFLADGVAAGLVTFALSAPAYVPIWAARLEGGDRVNVHIVLSRNWHSLRGTVFDDKGAALGGVAINLSFPRAEPSRGVDQRTRSQSDGTFSFHALLLPPYELDVEAPGFRHFSQVIETSDDHIGVYLERTF